MRRSKREETKRETDEHQIVEEELKQMTNDENIEFEDFRLHLIDLQHK